MDSGYSRDVFDAAIRPMLANSLSAELESLLQKSLQQLDGLLDTIHQFDVESVSEPALAFQATLSTGNATE